jgi:hypothetical protein
MSPEMIEGFRHTIIPFAGSLKYVEQNCHSFRRLQLGVIFQHALLQSTIVQPSIHTRHPSIRKQDMVLLRNQIIIDIGWWTIVERSTSLLEEVDDSLAAVQYYHSRTEQLQ